MTFNTQSFNVFTVEGLEPRMAAIREEIWPDFENFASDISAHLEQKLHSEEVRNIHIAQHARRTVYAPEGTWVAVGGNKRGYKKFPHFQIGINADYVFIALACIDNPTHEKEIAQDFADHAADFQKLPADYVIIPDHTVKDFIAVSDVDCAAFFERVARVKKAEFMIGRIAQRGSELLRTDESTRQWMIDTVDLLLPHYRRAMSFYATTITAVAAKGQ
ncbi:DUF1054 family protein [Alloscardovia omnicolens]|uniref:DUF1054 family protein n=1 Tax=Alloscardovia omnicolens TaxID=419015 RepID=UPI003A698191